jgi:drug/metabolite transporter (DMT)-like permease
MAMGCAICGSLCNILINKCDQIRSTILVFYAGLCGVFASIIGCLLQADTNRIVTDLESLLPMDWVILIMTSLVGIMAYFAMTAALKMITPTSVSVLRALEIVLAYLCQIVVMHQIPNKLCMIGATLVIVSVVGIAIEERYSASRRTIESSTSLQRTLQIGRTFVVNPEEQFR